MTTRASQTRIARAGPPVPLEILTGPGGARQVAILEEGLPVALRRAKQALDEGDREGVKALLSDRALATLEGPIYGPPARPDLMFLLGHLFLGVALRAQAAHWFREVLRFEASAAAHEQLGLLDHQVGRYREALDHRREALALDPDNGELWISLGLDLIRIGRRSEGLGWLRRYVERFPDNPDAHSKLLFHSHYDPGLDPATLVEMHVAWGRRHAPPVLARRFHGNDATPERRLRVGYLGADFYRHSAAYTFEAILDAHDRDRVTPIGYGHVSQPDEVTERLKRKFEHYRDVHRLDDRALARRIESDAIDILVILSGHTGGHRLTACACKPAPLLVDFGGINTTGLAQVDYRVTDAVRDLPEARRRYTEHSLDIETGFVCYRPPDAAPPVSDPPRLRTGHCTFGSFNNSMKIGSPTIALWAGVLRSVPGARMLLKFGGGFDPDLQAHLREAFARHGVDPERVTFCGWLAPGEHLKLYGDVDIALDTYPFNGGITTLESLWMGVPVVTLSGATLVSRCARGILAQAGLLSLAAQDARDFVARATSLATNVTTLIRIRGSLRSRLQASPLCDAAEYTRQLEEHYRRIWRHWCASSPSARLCRKTPAPARASSRPAEADAYWRFYVSQRSDLFYAVAKAGLPEALSPIMAAIESAKLDRARDLLTDETVLTLQALSRQRADVAFLLGRVLQAKRQWDAARAALERAARMDAHPLIHFELGNLYRSQGRLSQALAAYQAAVDLAPDAHELWTTLADCLIKMGRTEDGSEILRRVVTHTPDRTNHSKYLWHLHQDPALDRRRLFEAHCHWAALHAPLPTLPNDPPRPRDSGRRLRIGYLSPDFCGHSVAYFFESLLDGHDRGQVAIYGYGNVPAPDGVTTCLIEKFDHYRPIYGQTDPAVVRLIEADRIDILVDLAGHTGGNRLGVLARRAAPIQVSFLGYPDTTGMPQVDYRFTDRWAESEDAAAYHSETLVYLESGFICYRPPTCVPEVGPLPARAKGHVTFGSFNNNCKINERVLELWSAILKALPDARMILKFGGGDDPEVAEAYHARFRTFGVAPERIGIMGHRPFREHFALYNEIDLALDTFPYGGTTTTCEAFVMGVPTLSLVGDHHASRVGNSLLNRIGLEIFTAGSPREYVDKAVAFAHQAEELARIRRSLRSMLMNSPLTDARAYAACVEEAYRWMWRRHGADPAVSRQKRLERVHHAPY